MRPIQVLSPPLSFGARQLGMRLTDPLGETNSKGVPRGKSGQLRIVLGVHQMGGTSALCRELPTLARLVCGFRCGS